MAPCLQVSGMTKCYSGQVALDAIDFAAHDGEILGLIGPNGAGKTTLLECLAGLLPTDAGSIAWKGAPLAPNRRKTALFYVPDGIAPYAEHSVRTVLGFFLRAPDRPPMIAAKEVVEALALGPALDQQIGTLSKGYRRRLLLALGLLAPQPLLALDEPFDGFDLRQGRDVMGTLRNVAMRGRTLLLSIHQLTDAERICDRFVLLQAGRLRGEGTLDELRAKAGLEAGGLEEVFLALT